MNDINFRSIEALIDLSRWETEQVHGGARVDYFLKLEGIDGESTSKAGTHAGGGGHGAGKVSMRDFHF